MWINSPLSIEHSIWHRDRHRQQEHPDEYNFCPTHSSLVTKHHFLPFAYVEPLPESKEDHVSVKKKKTLCKQSQVGCTMRSSPALKQESINPPETCYSLFWHFKVRDGKVTCLKVPGSGLPLSIPASQPMTILWSHTRGPYNISHPTGKGHWEAVQTTWLLGVHLSG